MRTHDPSKRTAADLRVRRRGHWDLPCMYLLRLHSEALLCVVQLGLDGTHAETRFRF
jgi:hypothetical protein